MTDAEKKQLVLTKLQQYSLFQEDWIGKRIISANWSIEQPLHYLIEYEKHFLLQDWLNELRIDKLFVTFEGGWWVRKWKNEYPNPLRENIPHWSLHLTHDGNLKLSAHIDQWNPDPRNGVGYSILHFCVDVIWHWS